MEKNKWWINTNGRRFIYLNVTPCFHDALLTEWGSIKLTHTIFTWIETNNMITTVIANAVIVKAELENRWEN